MSTSIVLCESLIFSNRSMSHKSLYWHNSSNIVVQLSGETRRLRVLPPKAKSSHSKKRSWWKKFFSDDDGDKLGLKDEDMFEVEGEKSDSLSEEELSEGEKFEAWKSRAEAIIELREAQEGMRNEQNRRWEDWLVDETNDVNSSSWDQDWNNRHGKSREDVWVNPREMVPGRGLIKSVRDLVSWREDEDMLYEDRVFRYASINSAKFLALLVIIPWALDFLVHDYVFMPFLDRYVKTVPLAAELLDVRRYQKLEIVKELKLEKARYRLEVEIGKSPPLSDEDLWVELRHKALELRDGWRLENRRAFANILSDTMFGISLFILLYSNQNKVALLKFTGYKLINNISDVGKAFVIILIADIILGYHSDLGWKVFLDILLEHYGLEVDESSITIFICLVPVFIDTCVKLWLFKFLPGLSPKVSTILKEMKRH